MDRRLRWLVAGGWLAPLILLPIGVAAAKLGPTSADVVESGTQRAVNRQGQPAVKAAPARRQGSQNAARGVAPNVAEQQQPQHRWSRRSAAQEKRISVPEQASEIASPEAATPQPSLPQARRLRPRPLAPTVQQHRAGAPRLLPDDAQATPLNASSAEQLDADKQPTTTTPSAAGAQDQQADELQHDGPAAKRPAQAPRPGKLGALGNTGSTGQREGTAPPTDPVPEGDQADQQGPALGPVLAPAIDLAPGSAASPGQPPDRARGPAESGANEPPRAANDVAVEPEPPAAYPVTIEPLSPELLVLRDRVRLVLRTHAERRLNTRDHTPWEVMHRIVAYGTQCEILRGGPQGTPVNAIGWLLYGGKCKGQRIVHVEQGRIAALQGVGVQGHPGQLLAIIAQARARADYPIVLDGRTFTLADLIESEKLTCRSGMELTFKLIALSWYLDSDATWRNAAGEEWSISRLVKEEVEAPILRTAACGGTHRLMGLTYAVREREQQGKPIDGQFLRAQKYLADYHEYTFKLQNADGSFSTEWFVRRGARPDLDRRVQTTGHILEWLVYSIPESMLRDQRVVRAVDYLSGILAAQPNRQWEIGPLGHALHALAIYDERVFAPHDSAGISPGAATPSAPRAAARSNRRRQQASRQ